jgi:hypothetical protein
MTGETPLKTLLLGALVIGLSAAISGCATTDATAEPPTDESTVLPVRSGASSAATLEPSPSPTTGVVPKPPPSIDLSPEVTQVTGPTPVPTVELPDLIVVPDAYPSPPIPPCDAGLRLYFSIRNIGSTTPYDFMVHVRDVSGGVEYASTYRSAPTLEGGQAYGWGLALSLPPGEGCGAEHEITITVDATNLIIESNEGNNTYTFTYTRAPGLG